MAESNGNGGPSRGSIALTRTSVKRRSRKKDGSILLQELMESCQALKSQVNAQKNSNKAYGQKPALPKITCYEKVDPLGKKAKRNARHRANYKARKERSFSASRPLTRRSSDAVVRDVAEVHHSLSEDPGILLSLL